MRYGDIEVGKFYLYDKDNSCRRIDSDINVVKVLDKNRFLFRTYVRICPVMPDKGVCLEHSFVIENEEMLSKMNSNPAENVVIRYPSDAPVFSSDDCVVMSKAFMYALKNAKDCKLSEGEVLKMSSIVQKVKFYAELSEKYRPIPETDTEKGE